MNGMHARKYRHNLIGWLRNFLAGVTDGLHYPAEPQLQLHAVPTVTAIRAEETPSKLTLFIVMVIAPDNHPTCAGRARKLSCSQAAFN